MIYKPKQQIKGIFFLCSYSHSLIRFFCHISELCTLHLVLADLLHLDLFGVVFRGWSEWN